MKAAAHRYFPSSLVVNLVLVHSHHFVLRYHHWRWAPEFDLKHYLHSSSVLVWILCANKCNDLHYKFLRPFHQRAGASCRAGTVLRDNVELHEKVRSISHIFLFWSKTRPISHWASSCFVCLFVCNRGHLYCHKCRRAPSPDSAREQGATTRELGQSPRNMSAIDGK